MKKNSTFRFLISFFRLFLIPFSLFVGQLAALRRKAFQKGWLNATTFQIPTICIGNLCVGGSGKTPLVEYLTKFLSQHHQVAILSRGYGRKSKGYINAQETSELSSKWIGDESMQYVTKFPDIEIAVCEKRKIGIEKLISKTSQLEAVILDDAFQHLSVNYSLKIVLTEYDHPFINDLPFPTGSLREFKSASKYADIIIVTKCPDHLSQEEKTLFKKKLKLLPHQELFYTKIKYEVQEVESQIANHKPPISKLLITGIANPDPLVQFLESKYGKIEKLHFSDHHVYTKKDIQKIIRVQKQLEGTDCVILTTEKDSVKLQEHKSMPKFYTIPIEIVFLDSEDAFKEKLLSLLAKRYA